MELALILDRSTLTAAFQCAGVMVVIHHPKKNRTALVVRKSSGGKKYMLWMYHELKAARLY